MSKVVVIGGGTGLSSLIKGLKNVPSISKLSAIVTVSDNGGSTKELRNAFNIPAVGDIRQVVVALSENESTIEEVFKYRFGDKIPSLNNHSLGNLIITALIDMEDDFYKGIQKLNDIFELKGKLIPITNCSNIELCCEYEDNSIARGETSIPNKNKKIKKIFYENTENIIPNPKAIESIKEADYIIFGIGSLYTSIISNLVVPGVKEAISKNTKAKKIYFGNIMTEPGETDNYSMYDHVTTIENHIGKNEIDYLIYNSSKINDDVLKRYHDYGSMKVEYDNKLKESHVISYEYPLLDSNASDIKHSPKKICKCFTDFLDKLNNK